MEHRDTNGTTIHSGSRVATALDGPGTAVRFESNRPSTWVLVDGRRFASCYFDRGLTVTADPSA